MRVHELAKKWKVPTRRILLVIKELKIKKKTPLSILKPKEIEKILSKLDIKRKKTTKKKKISKDKKGKTKKAGKKLIEKKVIETQPSSLPEKKGEEEKPKGVFIDRGKEIPARYGVEHLVILPVNPYKIFAYWELEKERQGEAILRVYYRNRKEFFDLSVDIDSMSWYIDVPEDGVDYQAELGIMDRSRFVPVLRSNVIKLPRKNISEKEEVKLAKFKELIKEFKLDVKGRSSLERARFEEIRDFLKRFKFVSSSRKK